VDIAFHGNFCTDLTPPYVTEHAESLVQLLENPLPGMNNLSLDSHAISSTLWSKTLESCFAVDGNETVGQPGTEFVPRLENGGNFADTRFYAIQAGNNSGVFKFPESNYFNGSSFGPRENFVPIVVLQDTNNELLRWRL
jgi:hypothetical protein